MALTYNGNGRFIPGVPASDLDDSTIKRLADENGLSVRVMTKQLTTQGLYSVVEVKKTAKDTDESKEV